MLLKVNIIWKQNIWISTKYYFNSHINKKGDCLRNTNTPYIIRCILISNTCRCQTPLQYIILLCHFSKLWNTDTPYITTCILVSNTYRCQTPTHTYDMIITLNYVTSRNYVRHVCVRISYVINTNSYQPLNPEK
jgi:hypothetical protein